MGGDAAKNSTVALQAATRDDRRAAAGEAQQEIRFVRSPDGTRLAWSMHGSGQPLVNVACWLSHLQFDWQSPVWRHLLVDLGQFTTLVRYDERGSGLSDWDVEDFSLEARVRDLETIVDQTGLERFALLGMSPGGHVAIDYAVRHPERVTHLILLGAWAGGGAMTAEELAEEETYLSMIRVGWAREDPRFRRVFTTRFIPDATPEQMAWFDDLQRLSTSAENAVKARVARRAVDVTPLLPKVRAPTLVLQARQDAATDFDEGRQLAALIPGARFVPLESRNHILLGDEPAWQVLVREVEAFLAEAPAPRQGSAPDDDGPNLMARLTARELEILRLAAQGMTNEGIAEALTLSQRTIERHLSNVYLKLGVSGKAARTAAVARLLRR
jgi:pimeloyl-ACP methyl ester carboxylesterase/DNA-binding CsgD family transcriptional regulator